MESLACTTSVQNNIFQSLKNKNTWGSIDVIRQNYVIKKVKVAESTLKQKKQGVYHTMYERCDPNSVGEIANLVVLLKQKAPQQLSLIYIYQL